MHQAQGKTMADGKIVNSRKQRIESRQFVVHIVPLVLA